MPCFVSLFISTKVRAALAIAVVALLGGCVHANPVLSLELDEEGATVLADGELFARYAVHSGTKPIVWPIVGPSGVSMTRGYPMTALGPHESKDHVHHRSLWFGYEGINDVDFWHETKPKKPDALPIGQIKHRAFTSHECDGNKVVLVAENDYTAPDGSVVAQDERTLQFGVGDKARWIDVRLRLWSADRPLVLHETKEGAFCARVAGTMKVDEGLGGRIVNSRGDSNKAAWGTPAEWVDYSGPVDGKTVGLAIFSHPSSVEATPCWHVRTYGLFAANPFSHAAYKQPGGGAGFRSPAGEPVTLRYRVYLHDGDAEQGQVSKAFARYAAEE